MTQGPVGEPASERKAGGPPPDPEQAWKALTLVNDWVKYAETKIGLILAATGVSGAALFNLVKDRAPTGLLYNIAAGVCGASVVAAGLFAMIGLYPRIRLQRNPPDDTVNPLFFHDIARAYQPSGPSYGAVLHTLTASKDDLVNHISHQVQANATVASRKFQWANRAVQALIVDLITLGVLATIVALQI